MKENIEVFIILDQFEEYFVKQPEACKRQKFLQDLLNFIRNPSKSVHLLVSIHHDSILELNAFFGDSIPGEHIYFRMFKDSQIEQVEPGNINNSPYHSQKALQRFTIEPGLADEVLEGVTNYNNKKPIETSLLQLVMERLWTEEYKQPSTALRIETFHRLGNGEQNEELTPAEKSVKQIAKDYLDARLKDLSDKEKDIAASIFHYLVAPSGYKLSQGISDLRDFANTDRKLRESPLLEEHQIKGLLKKLSERDERGGQDVRIVRLLEGGRYQIFHDVLCEPILNWERSFRERQEIERLEQKYRLLIVSKERIVLDLVRKSLECKGQDFFVRKEEKSAILALQAYRFNQQCELEKLNEVDEALRQAINTPYFSPILSEHDRKQVASVAFHPDSEVFASAGFDGTVRIWNLQKKTSRAIPLNGKQRLFNRDLGGVLSAAISPDKHTLAVGSGDHKVWIVDLDDLDAEPRKLSVSDHSDEVWSVAFSPDGRILASGGWDTQVCLWDLIDPKNPVTICHITHPDQVWSLAFSGNGQNGYVLAAGCLNGTVWLWKIKPDHPIKQRLWKVCVISNEEARDHKTGEESPLKWNRCFSIALESNGRSLFAGSQDGKIHYWDLSKLKDQSSQIEEVMPTKSILQKNANRSVVAISDDKQRLASGDSRGIVTLWKFTKPDDDTGVIVEKETELKGHSEGVSSVCFSRCGQWLVSASWAGTVRLWDLNPPAAEPIILREHSQPITAVAFSPDSKKIASSSYDRTIRLWDVSSVEGSRLLKDHDMGNVNSIAFNSDGSMLAAGIHTGEIRIWELDKPQEKFISSNEHRQEVTAVTFHPQNSKKFASGSNDRTIRLWDLSNLQNPKSCVLGRHEDRVTSVTFDLDGKFIASGSSDGTVKIWHVEKPDPSPILLPNKLDGKISSIAFSRERSREGQLLAIATERRTVQVWDLSPLHKSSKARPCFRSEYRSFKGMYLAFSPDGLILAIDGRDGNVLLCNSRRPKAKPVCLEGHTPVKTLAFSPNGQWLAVGGEDNTVRLWIANTDCIAKIVCQKVWRNLSREEWNYYVGEDTLYEFTCPELPAGEHVSAGECLDILKEEFENKLVNLFPEQKMLLEIIKKSVTANKVNYLPEDEIKKLIGERNLDHEVEVPCEIQTLCGLEFLVKAFESGVAINKYGLSSRYLQYLSTLQ